jgi:elongation factor P hydroxylase
VIYREDYLASALHEVAHWCLAGAERRTREDYGYWYSPDGRNAKEQAQFELVEVGPQALEWILTDACEFPFHLSVDNLTMGVESSSWFESEVAARKQRLLARGLPPRAAVYQRALARLIEDQRALRSHRSLSPLNRVNRQT